jgi:hypothetical protein
LVASEPRSAGRAATPLTASATDEFGTSRIMSTPSRSNHWRAMLAPMSGLFW